MIRYPKSDRLVNSSTTDDGRQRLVRHGHLPEREIMTIASVRRF
jgi:hypothetical protein